MTVWVLFVVITVYNGGASFQYEFKDLKQCQAAFEKMQKYLGRNDVIGFCQEVRK